MTLGLASVLASLAPAAAAAAPYNDGDKVQFTGVVTDAGGKPLPGVEVALSAARRYISLRGFRRADKDERRVATTTDAKGEYSIEWTWDDFYNHFELLAGVTVRHGRKEGLEVLEREDVSTRVEGGSPVVAAIVVHNRAFVDRLHEFLASVQSPDERRVYEEMGLPDDVKRVQFAGRLAAAEDAEVSWWYFDAGRSYLFRGGRLAQVDRFDPVQRF